MKNIFKTLLALFFILGHSICLCAQNSTATLPMLQKIESYQMEVTFDKTSHLIFPSRIVYVDLGSENLIAGKVEDAENVLRIKASVMDFKPETNFSVITADGRFYSFDVIYNSHPITLSYDLRLKTNDSKDLKSIFIKELGLDLPSSVHSVFENIYIQDKQIIRRIKTKNSSLDFSLKGIFINGGKFYFHTQITNSSNVSFQIEYVNFKIVDKRSVKRTAIQTRILPVIRTFKPVSETPGNKTQRNVFLLNQFAIEKDKMLLIEIFEKNSGRSLTLKVKSSDLLKAKLIVI